MSGSASGTVVLKVVNRFWHERLGLVVVYRVLAYAPPDAMFIDMPQYLIDTGAEPSGAPHYPLDYRLN